MHWDLAGHNTTNIRNDAHQLVKLDYPETLMMRQNVAMMLEEMGRVKDAGTEIQNVFNAEVRLL